MDEMMFCYQCEQAANCTACTGKAGVCGKSAETADAQDKLTGALIGFATLLLDIGRPIRPPQALLLTEGLFTTITNVDFDPQTVAQLTDKVWKAKQEAFASASPAPAPVSDYDMQKLWQEPDPDRKSLCSFVLFGLRGMAAYSYHARVLGYTDGEIDLFFCTALRAIAQERDKDKLFQLVEDTGRMAYRVMAELDKANTGAFGDPEPVEVSLTIEKGPFIVISGHDLYDAKCLLEQTEGKGINVYTHSEMLPAHGYPELKKRFPHLKGNFGTAWQNQQREFEDIPAPVLFTTNCIMPLRPSYADRVFTTSVVSYPGVTHIGEDRDFSPVIAKALELGGYPEDTLIPGMNGGSVVATGFAHHAVLSHAEEIVQAVHEGAIRHFFLIGGCDGTACTISDQLYGVFAGGTMAHSWVQMFDSEYEAFKRYCELYPTNAVLLVDTYNTLHSGIPNAIRAFNEVLKPKGITKCGIRLDSGDLAYLTRKARKMLDEAGWTDCKISVSNSLDEYLIQDMLLQGAQIDLFGVGERMITAKSEPVFGGVYKLVAVEDADGTVVPKIKVSENVEKITIPHFKKVFRLYGRDTGKAIADYLTLHDETVDDTTDLTIFDPMATWKRKDVYNFEARELLVPVFLGGKRVYDSPSLDEIKAYCAQQVDTLWDEVKRFDYPHKYYVDLSQKLWDIQQGLLRSSR